MRVLALLLATLVVSTMVLWGLQRRLLYFPGGAVPPVEQVLPGGEEVALSTSDGHTLGAWWVPGGATAVVVYPGNAGNRAGRVPLAQDLAALGLSVLLVDYRGYGGNQGAPSEDGLLADGRAAMDWVTARDDVVDVVLFGESLGAGVAIGVAAPRPPAREPAALVLRSPFTSVVDVARAHYGPVPTWLVWDRFPSEERITDVSAPVLVLGTEDDEVVPVALSRRLAEVAGARLVPIDATGHNDPALVHGDRLVAAVADFLRDEGLLSGR